MEKEQTLTESELRLLRLAEELGITFIDLKMDYAFKIVFGTPGHEDMLLLLLNGLMPEKHIKSAQLGPQEQKSDREDAKDGIYDILCTTDDGSSLTIEMQVCAQADFNDRMVFYSSFPIRDHVGQGMFLKNGKMQHGKYKLPPIYTIGILDFELEGVKKSNRIIRHFSIREDEDDKAPFTDSIHYVTVELPKFNKVLSNLSSTQDFILYLIQNIGTMEEIPKEFLGKGFDRILESCMFANMDKETQIKYMHILMADRDRAGQLDYARNQGLEEGEAKGRAEGEAKGRAEGEAKSRAQIAAAMKAKGYPTQEIAEMTGLTQEQIAEL